MTKIALLCEILRVHRVLKSAPPALPGDVTGHVAGAGNLPDGTRAEGLFAALRPACDPASQ
ncbi:hypothetical protein [Streptomyces sp. NPDC002952]|uniref:hypothetical protein n=1 Tax=Streptomyces sp. NPDC002952 TaxID=3364673 RepID=UPI00368D7920